MLTQNAFESVGLDPSNIIEADFFSDDIFAKIPCLFDIVVSHGFIEHFEEIIGGITLDSVNSAVRTCFDPERLIIVGVGRRSEVFSELSTFGTPGQYHFKDRLG